MNLNSSIKKLIGLGSAPLAQEEPILAENIIALSGNIFQELISVLKEKNGFYAFEFALHFFPAQTSLLSVGMNGWNSSPGWRDSYGDLAERCLFFAEDVFGGQFCIYDDKIWSFDPETGEKDLMGDSLDDWAQRVLDDFEVLTGHPIARMWQEVNGPLPEFERLVPRTPFVCNGEFSASNMILMDAERSMYVRGGLAQKIRDLPDGSQIKFEMKE